MWDVAPSLSKLEDAIRDPSNAVGMRMRAAYFLKQSYVNDPSTQEDVIRYLCKGLSDARHGSLMRHEFAYVMGQMQDERCCEVLEKALLDDSDCSMVRHEAAEALAAIGAKKSRTVIEETMEKTKTNLPEIYETCLLALNIMDWRDRGGYDNPDEEAPVGCACMLKKYSSVDPAPPHPAHEHKTDAELGDILCDSQQSMFDRYRAMFSLRNRGGEQAVLQLCRALSSDTSSALLRHEVSYVLGQMQHPSSIPALEASLRKTEEHQMVRHESAEALGAIEGDWDKVETILQEFCSDENQVVRESCLVALDAADYWGHNTSTNSDSEEKKEAPDNAKALKERAANQEVLNHHFNTQS